MKKLVFIIGLWLSFVSAYSQTKVTSTPLIKSIYEVNSQGVIEDSTNYYYDKQGRCIRVCYSDSYFGYNEKYDYPNSSTVVINKVYTRNNETLKTTYLLNKRGLAEKVTRVETKRYGTTVKCDTVTDRIVYNKAGFSIELGDAGCQDCTDVQLKEYQMNIESLLFVVNNNIVKRSNDNRYKYNTTIRNTIGNKNMGISFLGRDNANVVKEQKVPVMDTYSTTTYTYKTDKKGRVVKMNDSFLTDQSTVYNYY